MELVIFVLSNEDFIPGKIRVRVSSIVKPHTH